MGRCKTKTLVQVSTNAGGVVYMPTPKHNYCVSQSVAVAGYVVLSRAFEYLREFVRSEPMSKPVVSHLTRVKLV